MREESDLPVEYAILISFEGIGVPAVPRSGMDEWGRARDDRILITAWKSGFRACCLPRVGDAISSRSLGEALTSHLERPTRVTEVMHTPIPPDWDTSEEWRFPTAVVEIRQEVAEVSPSLIASISKSGWMAG